MLLTYVDESFTDCLYWIGALLVPDRVAMPLSEALDQMMDHATKTYGVPPETELHGYDIFHARSVWKGVPPAPGSRSTARRWRRLAPKTSRSSFAA
ncbi:hypothetical protein OG777_09185 [Micromonospora peucetia]|uniref:hypothetical protein n=1 Tax=Micromonospora peucetia TaxID=47871 RepID=UPI0022504A41|nr:hypothetical protein [Micromonospora peucetia]MCX4387102.1 hypothetical protein [Micromonospora peucetia]